MEVGCGGVGGGGNGWGNSNLSGICFILMKTSLT